MDDDDDLWGPPLVVKDDSFRKLPLRGCEFWFDFRTDVLEESFQIERYCELVWTILNEKKKIDELDKDVASYGSGDSVQDKTLLSATLPDAGTSSSLDEDENTSSISDAQTMQTTNDTEEARLKPQETEANDAITVEVVEDGDTSCSPVLEINIDVADALTTNTKDSTEEIDPETRLNPQETAANDAIKVVEDVDTSLSPVLESMIEEAEEHSCSSLVTHQACENKSPSAISQENHESSTLTPLVVETREKASGDGETLKDHQEGSDSLQVIETASEPFTTESLLEMCDDEPEKVREPSSKRSMPEAVKKTVVKDELIMNMLTEARIKVENKAPGSVLNKKRKRVSDTGLIRNTKQKVRGETPTMSAPPKVTKGPSVPPLLSASTLDLIERIRQRGRKNMGEQPVILVSELNDKTGKELRGIAKELKVTHYYKMKKEDLLQHCIMNLKLKLQLTECKEQSIESS